MKWFFLAQSYYHSIIGVSGQNGNTIKPNRYIIDSIIIIPLYQFSFNSIIPVGSPPLPYHEKYACGLSGSSNYIIKAMHCTINPAYPRGLTIIIFIVNMAFSQHFNNNLLVKHGEMKGWYYVCGFPLICEEMCFLFNLI